MARTLFVANLDESVQGDDLNALFSPYGKVNSARVWIDFETRASRGFGFVEMEDDYGAKLAIEELNGRWWVGRRLKVSFARPRGEVRF